MGKLLVLAALGLGIIRIAEWSETSMAGPYRACRATQLQMRQRDGHWICKRPTTWAEYLTEMEKETFWAEDTD